MVLTYAAFLEELWYYLCERGCIEAYLTAAQSVFCIGKQLVERHHGIYARHISRYMVGISDAHIRSGISGNIGYDIVVNTSVIGVEADIYMNIRVECFKVRYSLRVNIGLGLVGIVFCPEGDLVVTRSIKSFGNCKLLEGTSSMAAGKKHAAQHEYHDSDRNE